MDTLPTELLYLIFSFACTDGGYTGASLSAVCKRIRTTSLPYALHTVSLHDWSQIVAFSTLLDARAPDARCVHHLFMTDRRGAYRTSESDSAIIGDTNTHTGISMGGSLKVAHRTGSSSRAEHAYSILARLGPTLRTLTLLLFDDESTSSARTLGFPVLQELTIHSSFFRATSDGFQLKPDSYEAALRLRSEDSGDEFDNGARRLVVESLRRLHVVQNIPFDYDFVERVSQLAPRATHLRLSQLSCAMFQNGNLVSAGVAPFAAHDPEEGEVGFPETLEQLQLQFRNEETRVAADWTSSRPSAAYYAVFLQTQTRSAVAALREYVQRDTNGRISVLRPHACEGVLGPAEQRRLNMFWDAPHYVDIEESWKERAIGGEGIWKVGDADVMLRHGYDGQ
ncbi:hypothetical protein C8Q80DRAFT_1213470 [Daedaleopsis nitida]|nr:hypothetical protein C8Q80DRAFT_1213470 [Daedaleopsis nitida]